MIIYYKQMPVRRYKARPRRRRTTRAVRPFKMFRRPRFNRPSVYYYKQVVDGSLILGIGSRTITQQSTASNFAPEFRVSSISNWSALSSLYDQFCISKVVLKFIPMVNVNNVQPLAGSTLTNPGLLATVIDTDDASPLSTIQEYEQYQSFKSQPAISMKTHTRVVRPAIRAVGVATGGAQQPSLPKSNQWIDCAYSTTSHFGVKIFLDAYGNFNASACYQVQAIYYLKFRNVR